MKGTRKQTECNYCGGTHETFPTEDYRKNEGEVGANCPHCGEWLGLDEQDPTEIERHPAVPKDEPVDCHCSGCGGTFSIRIPPEN